MLNLSELLTTTAARAPDTVALRVGDFACTYSELTERARRVAGGLTAAGAVAGDRVAMFLPNCPELVDLYFGCWLLGCVAVPLNHRYLAREAQFALEHCATKVFVTHVDLVDRVEGIAYEDIGVSARYLVTDAPTSGGWRPFERARWRAARPVDRT